MYRLAIEKLNKWREASCRMPLLIKGARQVGKTYVLQQFGQAYFPNYHYLSFEEDDGLKKIFDQDLKPQRIIEEISFHINANIDIKKDLLILDEIQDCPRALTSLKYFCEKMPDLAVCAAGSLLGVQISEESFPVGKVDIQYMFPMTFREFLLGIGDQRSYDFLRDYSEAKAIPEVIHGHLWEQLKIYFIVGGLPKVVETYAKLKNNKFEALKEVRELQKKQIDAYNADIAKHSGKQNAINIQTLWKDIPAQLAKEMDDSSSKFVFKDVVPGIKGYSRLSNIIHWLVAAGLIIKVPIVNSAKQPFSAYTKENYFKLFMFDVGILGALSNLAPKAILDYDYGTYKGYFAENFIAQEFTHEDQRPGELYSWKEGRAELEFIRELEAKVYPIEVKSGRVIQAKSIHVFAKKYKSDYKVIMSSKNFLINKDRNTHYYPLYLASHFPLDLLAIE